MPSLRLLAGLSLTVLVSMLAVPAAAQQSHGRVALLIANASYPDAEKPLPFAVKDATAIAAQLRRLDFNVELKTNLGKRATQQAIDAFIGRLSRGETALFYFSGFGLQVERQTYLIPVDAQIWSAADVRRDGESANALVARMQHKGASAKIIVIDAGRRNPYERRFRSVAAGLAPFEMPVGTLALYSTAIGKIAENLSSGGQSLFAAALLRQLRSPDKSVEQLFNRARIDVSRASTGKQVPWVASSLLGEIYFGNAPAGAAAAASREPAPVPLTAKAKLADSKTAAPWQPLPNSNGAPPPNANKPVSPSPRVAALPPQPAEPEKSGGGGGLAQAGTWQTVDSSRRHRIVCVFVLEPNGHYHFSKHCPEPYTGEVGEAAINASGRYTMHAKSGRVERGTITMVGKDKLIARSGGGRVVWTRID
jgi:Caspase domain